MADEPNDVPQPRGWSWQDRAQGSIPQGRTLDPAIERVDGVEAFPTAYVPDRLLVTREVGANSSDLGILRQAAAAFGWELVPETLLGEELIGDDPDPGPILPGLPSVFRARLRTPDEPVRGESPVPPDA